MARLQRIDEIMMIDHYYLNENDKCHYLLDYTAQGGYSYSESNSLLLNFKKKMDKKGSNQWHYKEDAINKLGKLISDKLSVENLKKVSFVPVPPSKAIGDPLYDDRLIRILNVAFGENGDIREVLNQKNSRKESHLSDPRPTVENHINGYSIDEEMIKNLRKNIIIFDDILTSGAQYKACKDCILKYRTDVNIIGLFLARRVPVSDF